MRRWSGSFHEELRQRRYEGQLELADMLEEEERGDLLPEMLDELHRADAAGRLPARR